MKKTTKPKFDTEKFIELCNQREMKMYELRKKGVPFSQRLKAVLPISIEITKMTLGERTKNNFINLNIFSNNDIFILKESNN